MRLNNPRAVTLIAVLAFSATATFSGCNRKPDTVVIGAILPLTGNAAQWGIPPRNGAQLGVDEINAKGGIGGRRVVLAVEDDQCEPRFGVTAFNKIVSLQHASAVVGAVCSGVTLALAPLANRDQIVLISPASTSPKVTEAGDFVFRDISSDDVRGRVFAEYLFNEKKLRNVALLYVNNEGGKGQRDAFRGRFLGLGGTVGLEEAYGEDTSDLRTQLTKVKASSTDALVVISYPRDTIIALRQVHELGVTKPLYFPTEAIEDPNVLRETGRLAEGVTYIVPAAATGEIPARFAKAYQVRYGKLPELFAAEAYDAVSLVAAALSSSNDGKANGVTVRDFLYRIRNYSGASGRLTFDSNGDVQKPLAVKTIAGGTPKVLWER